MTNSHSVIRKNSQLPTVGALFISSFTKGKGSKLYRKSEIGKNNYPIHRTLMSKIKLIYHGSKWKKML